jgi:hypothetical protein
MKFKFSSLKRRKSKTSTEEKVCKSDETEKLACEASALPTAGKEGYNTFKNHDERPPNFDAGYALSPPSIPIASVSNPGKYDRTHQNLRPITIRTTAVPSQSRLGTTSPTPVHSRPGSMPYMWLMACLALMGLATVLREMTSPFPISTVPECVQNHPFDPSGPVIALMGGTGTGKSSFIRDLQGRDSEGCLPKIGHGLQSCKYLPPATAMHLPNTHIERHEEGYLVLCNNGRRVLHCSGYSRFR